MTRRAGIFGGSFNPVHNGHLVMAHEAREQAGLERLLLVPLNLPPHKDAGDLLPARVRLSLLHLACAGQPGLVVDDREIRRGGISWSIDTVRELDREEPGTEWSFLIGQDSLPDLVRWREARALAELVIFLVALRPGAEPPLAELPPPFRVRTVAGTPVGISSTLVRARARAGLPLGGWVPKEVEAAIVRERHFRS